MALFVVMTILLLNGWFLLNISAESSGHCQSYKLFRVPVYTRWPFRVDCKHLKEYWRLTQNATAKDDYQCELTHDGEITEERIFELQNVGENKLFHAELIVNGLHRISGDVVTDLRPFPEESCQAIVDDAAKRGETKYLENVIGDRVDLRCKPPEDTPTLIPEGANRADFETYWFTKCERKKYRNNNLWKQLHDKDGYPDMLNMPRVDFWDATNFTCAVTYKGRTLYPVTYAQCIKQRTTETAPTVVCTEVKYATANKSAALHCVGQIVIGKNSPENFDVEWKKDGKIICQNQELNACDGSGKARQSCRALGNNDPLICVKDGDATLDDDIQRERKNIDMSLTITAIEASDFGKYSVTLKHRGNDGRWLSHLSEIELMKDPTPFYIMLGKVLGSVFAIVLFLVAVLLIWRYRFNILVKYKRSRLTKCNKDNKEWVAYLSYLFNGSPDTEEERKSSIATMKIVMAIHKVMKNLQYKCFDEQIQGDFSGTVENVTKLVEKCHRMILVLTPQYLDDNLRRFHAELGFHGLLESRMGLIVILTPESEVLLKRRAETDTIWKRLLITIKSNRSIIRWRENMSEDELVNRIEYALPKLRKSGANNRSFNRSTFLSSGQHEYIRI